MDKPKGVDSCDVSPEKFGDDLQEQAEKVEQLGQFEQKVRDDFDGLKEKYTGCKASLSETQQAEFEEKLKVAGQKLDAIQVQDGIASLNIDGLEASPIPETVPQLYMIKLKGKDLGSIGGEGKPGPNWVVINTAKALMRNGLKPDVPSFIKNDRLPKYQNLPYSVSISPEDDAALTARGISFETNGSVKGIKGINKVGVDFKDVIRVQISAGGVTPDKNFGLQVTLKDFSAMFIVVEPNNTTDFATAI